MIQRLYRLLLLFCSIAVFAACSDSDGNNNNGGNGGEIVPDGGDTYGYVTDANGKTVALTDLGSGKYTFKMPSAQVNVGFKTTADQPCDGGKDCPSAPFTDVDTAKWYHLSVD